MDEVYSAQNTRLERSVALELVSPDRRQGPGRSERLLKDARLCRCSGQPRSPQGLICFLSRHWIKTSIRGLKSSGSVAIIGWTVAIRSQHDDRRGGPGHRRHQ